MSMTNCRECGKEISTLASACPSCGAPVSSVAQMQVSEVMISRGEMTSKRWKRIKLVSWLVIIGSLMMMGSDQQTPHGLIFWMSANFAIFALIGLIIAKIGAWWSHG